MSGSKLSDATTPRPELHDAPLGLTVHSLPQPHLALPDHAAPPLDARRVRLGRWKMLAVMLVCAMPVIASYLTYYVIRPDGQRHYGELITPQRPLPDLAVMPLQSSSINNLRALKGQWLLVSVAGGTCDAACERHLYLQRQLRESLGKEKDRLDRVWLVSDDADVPQSLRPALAQATVLRVPPALLAQWLAPAAGHELSEHLYVVDPLGNWMMRFPAGLDLASATQAKRDLDRLLRASASWDQPGRPGAAP